jgi:protein-L-isoaspartate(D-aspartate) O-methyltransferase
MTMNASTLDSPESLPEALRHAMVASQLRTNAVSDPRVVAAMAVVPREDYLPAGIGSLAYRDTTIPLVNGRQANPPMATGRLLTAAALRAEDRVLLIGAAGGYAAAVLARIVGSVTAVESDAALLAIARRTLAGMKGVALHEGPLHVGAPQGAPYDVLVVDGAVEQLPAALIEQVAIGGRVVAALNDRGVTRLASGPRTGGGFVLQPFADGEAALLPGFAPPARFSF